MKVETSRALLEKVASVTEVLNTIITENAVLQGRLDEVRLVSERLTEKFSSILAEKEAKDAMPKDKIKANEMTSQASGQILFAHAASRTKMVADEANFPALKPSRGRKKEWHKGAEPYGQ